MFKSKPLFCAQFQTKPGGSFLKKYQHFATDIVSSEKCDFFSRFWPKNRKGWSLNIETFHKEKTCVFIQS